MPSRTLALVGAFLLCCVVIPDVAEGAGGIVERIVRKDGSTITGEVIGFEDGQYSVRVGDSVVMVPAADVRTIDEGPVLPLPAVEPGRFEGLVGVQDVLDSIGRRPAQAASEESVTTFQDAVAAILRGEWDFSLRLLRRLLDSEPTWADPQILHGAVLMEQGDTSGSLRVAMRLEGLFPEDVLALRTTAEIYRRAGFRDRYARTLEQVIHSVSIGERLDYELTHLWWPLDPAKGAAFWQRYRESDPALRRPWCREGEDLRRAQLALAVEDWYAAQSVIDGLVRRFPWMAADTRAVRIAILEARLRSSEIRGNLEVALLSAATLGEIDSERGEHWRERRVDLEGLVMQQGLRQETVKDYRHWCNRHLHLLGGTDRERDQRLSEHFQTLALGALRLGDLVQGRVGLSEAAHYDADARPADLELQLAGCVTRVREELELGRRARALQTARLLIGAYPERYDSMTVQFNVLFRDTLEPRLTAPELATALDELRRTLRRPAEDGAPDDRDGERNPASFLSTQVVAIERDDAEERRRVMELALPAIQRYFPYAVGTRWVYKRGDGKLETRRVTALTPTPDGNFKITLRVTEEGEHGESYDTYAFVVGPDVLVMADSVPPGEYAMRYPFSDGASWGWEKGPFRYVRHVRRPTAPIHLPLGSYRDYFVVEAENSFVSDMGGEEHSVMTRLTYVAGVGLARIEAEDASLSRVLVEFSTPQP